MQHNRSIFFSKKLFCCTAIAFAGYINDDANFWKLQRESFESHAEAAVITGLLIHSRKSDGDTLDALKRYNGKVYNALLSRLSGAEFARKCLDLGGHIPF